MTRCVYHQVALLCHSHFNLTHLLSNASCIGKLFRESIHHLTNRAENYLFGIFFNTKRIVLQSLKDVKFLLSGMGSIWAFFQKSGNLLLSSMVAMFVCAAPLTQSIQYRLNPGLVLRQQPKPGCSSRELPRKIFQSWKFSWSSLQAILLDWRQALECFYTENNYSTLHKYTFTMGGDLFFE